MKKDLLDLKSYVYEYCFTEDRKEYNNVTEPLFLDFNFLILFFYIYFMKFPKLSVATFYMMHRV